MNFSKNYIFLSIILTYYLILNSDYNITLNENTNDFRCYKNEFRTRSMEKFSNYQYEFVKIQLVPQTNNLMKLFGSESNKNSPTIKEKGDSDFRLGGYKFVFYLNSDNKYFTFGLVCSQDSQINVIYQGISASDLELYDNLNFTLNTTSDKDIIIKCLII